MIPRGYLARAGGGPIPPVKQVSTARFPTEDNLGLEMVNSAMENNRSKFKENMEKIRHLTANYTDDEFFDGIEGKENKINDNPSWFRNYCEAACGSFPGSGAYLYDFKGHTISSPGHLRLILNDSDSNPYYIDESDGQDPNWGRHIWNQPLWIVPFDVQY